MLRGKHSGDSACCRSRQNAHNCNVQSGTATIWKHNWMAHTFHCHGRVWLLGNAIALKKKPLFSIWYKELARCTFWRRLVTHIVSGSVSNWTIGAVQTKREALNWNWTCSTEAKWPLHSFHHSIAVVTKLMLKNSGNYSELEWASPQRRWRWCFSTGSSSYSPFLPVQPFSAKRPRFKRDRCANLVACSLSAKSEWC